MEICLKLMCSKDYHNGVINYSVKLSMIYMSSYTKLGKKI